MSVETKPPIVKDSSPIYTYHNHSQIASKSLVPLSIFAYLHSRIEKKTANLQHMQKRTHIFLNLKKMCAHTATMPLHCTFGECFQNIEVYMHMFAALACVCLCMLTCNIKVVSMGRTFRRRRQSQMNNKIQYKHMTPDAFCCGRVSFINSLAMVARAFR